MKNIDSQSEYWDRVSASKTFTHPVDVERLRAVLPHDAKILDYGCGYGRVCDVLYRSGFRNVVGIDSSPLMIERGLRGAPHLDLQILSGRTLPYGSGVFDAVVLLAVLTCIPTDGGQKGLMRELSRVLRPGGILYLSDYWLQTNERNIDRYEKYSGKFGRYGVFELPEGTVVRHHDRGWIESLLKDFDVLDQLDIEVTTMNGNRSIGFQYFGSKGQKAITRD